MLIVSLLGCLGCWLFEWMVPARFQRFQHCKVSPKLPVLPTTPAGSLPSAEQ